MLFRQKKQLRLVSSKISHIIKGGGADIKSVVPLKFCPEPTGR